MAATGPRGSRVESFSFTFLHLFVFLQLRLQFLLKCFRHIYKMVARTQFKSQLERKYLPNFTKQNAQLHLQLTGKRSGSTGYDATLQNKTHRAGSVYQIKTHLLGSQILNEWKWKQTHNLLRFKPRLSCTSCVHLIPSSPSTQEGSADGSALRCCRGADDITPRRPPLQSSSPRVENGVLVLERDCRRRTFCLGSRGFLRSAA